MHKWLQHRNLRWTEYGNIRTQKTAKTVTRKLKSKPKILQDFRTQNDGRTQVKLSFSAQQEVSEKSETFLFLCIWGKKLLPTHLWQGSTLPTEQIRVKPAKRKNHNTEPYYHPFAPKYANNISNCSNLHAIPCVTDKIFTSRDVRPSIFCYLHGVCRLKFVYLQLGVAELSAAGAQPLIPKLNKIEICSTLKVR